MGLLERMARALTLIIGSFVLWSGLFGIVSAVLSGLLASPVGVPLSQPALWLVITLSFALMESETRVSARRRSAGWYLAVMLIAPLWVLVRRTARGRV